MGANGFSDIKGNCFYDGINWSALASKTIQPPFHLKQEKNADEENSQVISFDEMNTVENPRKGIDYYEGFYYEPSA